MISKTSGSGGRRFLPYAFTEHGVAMLSSALHSDRAIQVNIAIMRAFVQLRSMLATHEDLRRKISEMEKRYDSKFQAVFATLRQMLETPIPPDARSAFMPNPTPSELPNTSYLIEITSFIYPQPPSVNLRNPPISSKI